MPQYLKDLIDKVTEDDIPTNIFTIEDEDPMVILGKINEVIALLKNLENTINASDTKAMDAVKKAEQSLENSKQALEKAMTAEENSTIAVDKASHAETLATQAYNDVEQAVENAKNALADAQQAVTSANQAVADAQTAIDTANGIDAKAQSALDATEEQQLEIADIKAKNLEQDTAITKAQSTADGAVTKNTQQDATIAAQGAEITAIKATDVEQNGRLTALEDSDSAQDNLLATLSSNINDEAKTRADEDTKIRREITDLMTGESEINEEIKKDIDTLKTTKADATATDTRFKTNETHLTNIDTEQKTQNDRLTALEAKNVEQDTAIGDVDSKIDNYIESNDLAISSITNQIIDLQDKDTLLENNDSTMLDLITNNTDDITAIKAKDAEQDKSIKALQDKDTAHDTSIKSLQDKDTAHDTAIAKAQSTADGAVTKNTQQDAAIATAQSTADGAVTKNTEQDTAIATAQTTANNAMPKKGGQFTGRVSWADGALPSKETPEYFLTIEPFASGGKTFYTSQANAKSKLGVSALETMLGETQKDIINKDTQNVKLTGNQTISGVKTFKNETIFPNLAGIKVASDGPAYNSPSYVCVFNNNAAPQGMAYCSVENLTTQITKLGNSILQNWLENNSYHSVSWKTHDGNGGDHGLLYFTDRNRENDNLIIQWGAVYGKNPYVNLPTPIAQYYAVFTTQTEKEGVWDDNMKVYGRTNTGFKISGGGGEVWVQWLAIGKLPDGYSGMITDI